MANSFHAPCSCSYNDRIPWKQKYSEKIMPFLKYKRQFVKKYAVYTFFIYVL